MNSINETSDAIWAAIQRVSPAVTREEIAELLRVAMDAPTASEGEQTFQFSCSPQELRAIVARMAPGGLIKVGVIPAGTTITPVLVDDIKVQTTERLLDSDAPEYYAKAKEIFGPLIKVKAQQ